MSETIIHRHGQDATPITVRGTVEDVQATLDRARQSGAQFAEFTTTDGRAAQIAPSSVDHLEAVT